MSSYTVTVDGKETWCKTLVDVRGVVAGTLTSMLVTDYEGVSEGARAANLAFAAGTVEHALDTYGSWRTVVMLNGRPIVIDVRKHTSRWLWWRR